MSVDSVVAVFDEFGAAAVAAEHVKDLGIPKAQITFVRKDAAETIPSEAAVPDTFKEVEENLEALTSDQGSNPFTDTRSVLTLMAGKLFTGMIEDSDDDESKVLTLKDYQRLVESGKHLLVVTGSTLEVEQSSQAIAVCDPVQLNLHYATNGGQAS